jgi:tRNA A37 threonylcarbamoyladenosine dehydratase
MNTPFDHLWGRTELLVGAQGVARLAGARVAVFGLGGVGGYAAEALARAGVGYLRLVDGDVVTPSNRNRQIIALGSTTGLAKTEVMAARIRDINPAATLDTRPVFITPETVEEFIAGIDYAIDAIDQVASKVALLAALHRAGIFTVSCMGAARKLDPTGVRVRDLRDTQGCPLAKRVRVALRQMGVASGIPCIYSEEHREATHDTGAAPPGQKRLTQGSISYVPGIVGLTAAGVVINRILAGA